MTPSLRAPDQSVTSVRPVMPMQYISPNCKGSSLQKKNDIIIFGGHIFTVFVSVLLSHMSINAKSLYCFIKVCLPYRGYTWIFAWVVRCIVGCQGEAQLGGLFFYFFIIHFPPELLPVMGL